MLLLVFGLAIKSDNVTSFPDGRNPEYIGQSAPRERRQLRSWDSVQAAGEELYLWDGFREMIEKRAVDIIHPDLPTALHFAGSPIAFMANLHCAAAIPSFVALEHHGLDLPFWRDLVTGLDADYLQDGYVAVPDKPGLGVDLNYEGIEANLRRGGLFEPTDEWNDPKLGFWKPDNRWG